MPDNKRPLSDVTTKQLFKFVPLISYPNGSVFSPVLDNIYHLLIDHAVLFSFQFAFRQKRNCFQNYWLTEM